MSNSEQSSGWQPIDTAPSGVTVIVSLWAFNKPGTERVVLIGAKMDGEWRGGDDGQELYPPTHWMPLPTPPEGS